MPWRDIIWARSDIASSNSTPNIVKNESIDNNVIQQSSPPSSNINSPLNIPINPTIKVLLLSGLITGSTLLAVRFYKHNLKRVPTAAHLTPSDFHIPPLSSPSKTTTTSSGLAKRGVYGYVPSVGDGDNFRLFHTPGGLFLGWTWLPFSSLHKSHLLPAQTSSKPTTSGKKLDTIHVRLAGIDAPELPHFGRPEQPYALEAIIFLKRLVLGRNVRAFLYRRDQYERVVGTVYVSRSLPSSLQTLVEGLQGDGSLGRKALVFPATGMVRVIGMVWNGILGRERHVDVGLEMLRNGMATVYEAKFGSEFGGKEREKLYRDTEEMAKRNKIGMWKGKGTSLLEKRQGVDQVNRRDENDDKIRPWNFFGSWSGSHNKTVQKDQEDGDRFESPREYKNRIKALEAASEQDKKHSKTIK